MALDFVAGCIGGCSGVLVGHPFDTIKVHLQTQNPMRPMYRGTFHCMQTIIQRESVAGLYRGMSSPMCGVALINAVIFGVYGNVQRRLADPDSLKAHFLAGATAGLAQSFICSPMELAKIRIQVQSQRGGGSSGPLRCLVDVARHEGSRGVFRGLASTAARDSTGIAVYFVSYEWMCRVAAERPGQQLSTPTILLVGGLAGTTSWLSSFPIDVIKTRLQVDGMNGTPQRYQGFWDCYRQSVRTEGYACLGRGLVSTLLRAFPTNAATFAVVTWVFRLAKADEHSQKAEEEALGARPVDVQSGGLLLGGAPLLLGATEPMWAAFTARQQQMRNLVGWPRAAPERLVACFQVNAAQDTPATGLREDLCQGNSVRGGSISAAVAEREGLMTDSKRESVIEKREVSAAVEVVQRKKDFANEVTKGVEAVSEARTKGEKEMRTSGFSDASPVTSPNAIPLIDKPINTFLTQINVPEDEAGDVNESDIRQQRSNR